MKTAATWTTEYFNASAEEVGEEVFDSHFQHVLDIQLDSYRAGMEAAAGLLDARAKESNVAGTMLFYGMASTLIRTAAKTAQLP